MFFDLSLSILDLPQSEKEHTAKRNQMFITGWTENTELIISEIDGVPVSISRRIFPITTIWKKYDTLWTVYFCLHTGCKH